MIVLGNLKNTPIALSIKPNCLTISFESSPFTNVFSFDYEGRPWTAMIDNVSYRRGLDGKTVAKWLNPDSTRTRLWMSSERADEIAEIARAQAETLSKAIESSEANLSIDLPQLGIEGLKAASSFTAEKRKLDIEKYKKIFLPVGILPPDQYGAVVLQATEGCSFNACTFCNFYKDRPFKIKTPEDFDRHCQEVKKFLGKGLSLRRTIFLGDANALVISNKKLEPLLEMTQKHFDVEGLGGIYAFLDGVSGEKKTHQDYAAAASFGLKRVYIGLESGNDDLLRFLNKPSRARDVINAVNVIKKGGVAVGIIVLLGAGGKIYEKAHVHDTINTLNKMSLDLEDVIYFSELIESEGLAYTQKAYQQALIPLSEAERTIQGQRIEGALKFSQKDGTPHISRYDIREFVY